MGMLALALDVRLGKPGVYVLNAKAEAPSAADLWRGLRICGRTVWLSAVLSAMSLIVAP